MNAEIFAEWLRRQGHRVVRTQSSYWFDASHGVYQGFPYHWLIRPAESELTSFLRENRAIGLRYSTPVESSLGRMSYHVVYEAPEYTLERLDRRSRQNVNAGLGHCRVEPVAMERLAEEGWLLELDTVDRQGRQVATTRETWRRRYLSAADLPGFEAWAALVEGRIVASILTFKMDDCCEMISQQCHRDFLKLRVNNALAFTVTQTMINRPGVRSVFYALQSLDAPPSVDEFKFRMGYAAKPVRQRVVFHPWLKPFLVPAWKAVLKRLARSEWGGTWLPKAIGMLEFYFEGMIPLTEQGCPECLDNRGSAAEVKKTVDSPPVGSGRTGRQTRQTARQTAGDVIGPQGEP